MKLNNLLSFNDFSGKLPTNNQKKTKRTDVGQDILNEKKDFSNTKNELLEFFLWLDDNGFITGNAAPFMNGGNIEDYDKIIDRYISDKK